MADVKLSLMSALAPEADLSISLTLLLCPVIYGQSLSIGLPVVELQASTRKIALSRSLLSERPFQKSCCSAKQTQFNLFKFNSHFILCTT